MRTTRTLSLLCLLLCSSSINITNAADNFSLVEPVNTEHTHDYTSFRSLSNIFTTPHRGVNYRNYQNVPIPAIPPPDKRAMLYNPQVIAYV